MGSVGVEDQQQHQTNITKWMSESTERITRDTRDRAGWRRLVRFAARTADHHSVWSRKEEERVSVSVMKFQRLNGLWFRLGFKHVSSRQIRLP